MEIVIEGLISCSGPSSTTLPRHHGRRHGRHGPDPASAMDQGGRGGGPVEARKGRAGEGAEGGWEEGGGRVGGAAGDGGAA
jgi:hypothetical protein